MRHVRAVAPLNTLLFLMMVLALLVGSGGQALAQSNRPDSFADLAERLLPAVVNISTTQAVPGRRGVPNEFEEFFEDFFNRPGVPSPRPPQANSLGSGFIIDAENGYVVTNNHVIEGADTITVILSDERRLEATLIGRDERVDLAVLQVDPVEELVAVPWGDSDHSRVGEWILAIGNPFGLGGTVTAGIISARSRDINAGPYDDFLQTDASINRGNSGGPMFNLDGEVIGINTAIYSPGPTGGSVGIGFAISSNLARPVIEQLIDFGRTRRGWLGVRIMEVSSEAADALGLDHAHGALVTQLFDDSPATEAGIEELDVILTFNGQEVPEMRRLPRMVAETPVGREVDVEVWRDGQIVSLDLTLAELEAAEQAGLRDVDRPLPPEPLRRAEREIDQLGVVVANLTPDIAERFGIPANQSGVVVTQVLGAAPSDRLRVGTVIQNVNQMPILQLDDLVAALNEADRDIVFMRLFVDGQAAFTTVPVIPG